MLVKDVMQSPVHLIAPEASLDVAARRMRDENIGSLPVGDDDELLGMITDRDIVVRCVAESGDCTRVAVRDAMSAELLCCFVDQPVEDVANLMEEYQVRRLPVLDQQQRLVGIVSLNDLSGRHLKTQLHRVVFYKELATSASGERRRVPVAIVHITDRHGREEIEAAAIKKFERDRGGRPWHHAADGYEVVKPE